MGAKLKARKATSEWNQSIRFGFCWGIVWTIFTGVLACPYDLSKSSKGVLFLAQICSLETGEILPKDFTRFLTSKTTATDFAE